MSTHIGTRKWFTDIEEGDIEDDDFNVDYKNMNSIQITNNKTLDKRSPPPLTVSCSPSGDEGPTVYIVIQIGKRVNEIRTNENNLKKKKQKKNIQLLSGHDKAPIHLYLLEFPTSVIERIPLPHPTRTSPQNKFRYISPCM
jgi:hypothetical protein